MAVAWPEPDMSLLIQTYENRWVLTKNNVKSEKKKLKEFSVLWLLKDAKSWWLPRVAQRKQKEIMGEAGKSGALRKKCGQQW